jgi:hypothetical protein
MNGYIYYKSSYVESTGKMSQNAHLELELVYPVCGYWRRMDGVATYSTVTWSDGGSGNRSGRWNIVGKEGVNLLRFEVGSANANRFLSSMS